MTLLRSGEDAPPGGAAMSAATLHELALRWYGDRLDPAWEPRTIDQSQAILESVGLTGAFWGLDG